MRRRSFLAFTLLGVAGSRALAGSTAMMQVSARVLPRVQIAISQMPAAVQVTAADVRRGYVDAPSPVQLTIDSNIRQDLQVEFFPVSPWVDRAEVAGSPLPTLRVEMAPGRFTRRMVDVRMILSPSVTPGSYPWPLQVAALA